MALMLNIEVWARLSSKQNLKLWRVDDSVHSNINPALADNIQFDFIDNGWMDMIWILASIATGKGDPSLIAEILRSRPNHPARKGFTEIGKLYRTDYMLRFGMNMTLRRLVTGLTARRETWNQFGRNLFHDRGGVVREKSREGQNELFWFLTVMQNAIVLWNALAIEQAVSRARKDGITITDEDLKHILPTMISHINFIGRFNIDMDRKTPFILATSHM
jgi:TnpA family transposase